MNEEKDLDQEQENEGDIEQTGVAEALDLNWKEAAKKLKSAHAALAEDFSIDTYYDKKDIEVLRSRFNAKERTAELHAEIMALK